MNLILRIIFRTALLYLTIATIAFTAGQIIPIEFSEQSDRNLFYDVGFVAIPVSILLTLTGTIKRKDETKRKLMKIWLTIFASGLSVVLLFLHLFTVGFGAWVDLNVKFRNKENNNIKIVEQLYDIGAFGYGGQRVVKMIPLTPLFNYIEKTDTTNIDRGKWTFVNEVGDVYY